MLSKSKQKFIISLQGKKTREENRMFIVEGDKMVREYISSNMEIVILAAKPEYIAGLSRKQLNNVSEIIPVSYEELRKISNMKTPHNALAVVKMPKKIFSAEEIPGGLIVALDSIQDPGNMGTIIRAAAWFGIRNIVCSVNSVDVYNPKVVQATMGALLHTGVYYCDLAEFLEIALKRGLSIFGTYPEGVPLYEHKLDNKGVILLGNESRGISDNLSSMVTDHISIPKFTVAKAGLDSLNVGMAASIIFSEFARRIIQK
ncbi:MAG: TrmH family RNA methyltransferase [Bacteroidales bacterium]